MRQYDFATEPFELLYGLEYKGKIHRKGALRLPTMEDRECALEETPDDACEARIARHVWGRTIVSLGDLECEEINAKLLAELMDEDYTVLLGAENALRKKQRSRQDAPASEPCEDSK